MIASGIKADVLYGPAYKGIPLVTTAAIAYAELTGQDVPLAFNRKEAKGHGEGGVLVGAALQGNIVILDDVITAGTSVRESVAIIEQTGAKPAGVLIALDRQEKGQNNMSAVQEVQQNYQMPVVSIINLSNIVDYLTENDSEQLEKIKAYQALYGV